MWNFQNIFKSTVYGIGYHEQLSVSKLLWLMRGTEQKNKKHAKKLEASILKIETLRTLIEILSITDSFPFKTHGTFVMI